jgi:hypothetical protein
MSAAGRVLITTAVANVSVSAWISSSDGGRLEGTRGNVTLAEPASGAELLTSPLLLSEEHLGSTLRIAVRATVSDGRVVLDRVLDGEGFEVRLCEGPNVTLGCGRALEGAVLGHPLASLGIVAPSASVSRASFIDLDGRDVSEAALRQPVSLEVEVSNGAAVPFTGAVEAHARLADGREVNGTRAWANVTGLAPRDVARVRSPVFGAFGGAEGGSAMGIHVSAVGSGGASWLDEDVDAGRFPFARLSLREAPAAPSGPRQRIDATFSVGSCSLEVVCEGCLATCELHLQRAGCTISPRGCECLCSVRKG